MEIVYEALGSLLTLHHFLFLSLGVVVGLVVAILPGLGGVAGLSLVLPFVFGMDQASALALMIGILAPTATGDTFPSVLMGIPGSSASQATVLDGFPLAQQGKAAFALSAAFSASLIGGVIGALVLSACIYVARPVILAIGLGEQLLLIVLALSMVGMLTGRNIPKGLAACGVGLLIGSIGAAPATGELRYTFSTVYLSDGIPLVVLALGVFAMPEVIALLRSRAAISSAALDRGWREGIGATLSHWWLVLRCSAIGCIIGALPGLGGSVVDWVAYGHVVQTSKDRSGFGKGDIRGVIAPESANNAVRGGELVPTLLFGIPGSGAMALLMGGFILIGVQPGIRMISQDIGLTYLIIWSLALANILAAGLCIVLAPQIAKLTTIRYGYIGPVIIVLIVFTAFQATKDWGDLLALFALSLLGVGMKRFEWPRPALVIGFVLAPGFEAAVYRTAQVYGFRFLERPQSLVLVLLVALSLYIGHRVMVASGRDAYLGAAAPARRRPQLLFTAGLLVLTAFAIGAGAQTAYLSRLFPVTIGLVTAMLLLLVLYGQYHAELSHPVLADAEQTDAAVGAAAPGLAHYLGWLVGMFVLVWCFGYTIGSALFVVAFISVEIGRPVWRSLLFGAGTVAALTFLAFMLYLDYPRGLLPDFVELPWWLQ